MQGSVVERREHLDESVVGADVHTERRRGTLGRQAQCTERHTHTRTKPTLMSHGTTTQNPDEYCKQTAELLRSVLQPSSIRGLATPWTYFLHLSLSFWLALAREVLSTS